MRTPPPPLPEMTCTFLIQLVYTSGHQSVTAFLSGAPPPKKILDPPLNSKASLLGKRQTLPAINFMLIKGKIITVTINRMLVWFSDFLMNSCEASLPPRADDCGEVSCQTYQRIREPHGELNTVNVITGILNLFKINFQLCLLKYS